MLRLTGRDDCICSTMSIPAEPEGSLTDEQEEFKVFISGLAGMDLAAMYSSYRFLAEFRGPTDIWRRDVCRLELLRRDRCSLGKAELPHVGNIRGLLPEQA